MLDQFFTNDLIETLKELVREYDEYITDLAVHLCEKLAENYINMMSSIDFDEEERGESKTLKAANGCLNAINRIIESIGCQEKLTNKGEILRNVQTKLEVMLTTSLGSEFKDTHEYIVTCIAMLTSYSDVITDNLW